jgi:hypothetical protein
MARGRVTCGNFSRGSSAVSTTFFDCTRIKRRFYQKKMGSAVVHLLEAGQRTLAAASSTAVRWPTIAAAAATSCFLACTTTPARADAVPVSFTAVPPQAAINSPVFARWAPLPGQPGYLQSIAYVESRIRYVDPSAGFFVSSNGEICFCTRPGSPTSIYDDTYRTWCLYPQLKLTGSNRCQIPPPI